VNAKKSATKSPAITGCLLDNPNRQIHELNELVGFYVVLQTSLWR
jgi:hypothetical protein